MTNYSHLCMRCMQPLEEGAAVCPLCGDIASATNPPHALPTGTLLSERYMVGRLLKDGGDAALYAGYDTVLKAPITVREFFPQTLCERAEDLSLRAIRGCEQTYTDYMNKFLAHARVVARMRDLPASIPTYDIFQQNTTAYTVSEQCEGVSLTAYLEEHGGRMTWDEARPLFIPLLNSLVSWHQAGVFHLGLSPDVLIVGTDGKLHVSDFAIGEARSANSELTAELASGYAAPEQYAFGTTPTATADVYGAAAVIFRTLVGSPPPDGETRPKTNADLTVPSEVASEFPPHVASALFSALQPSLEKRLSSLALLRDRLAEAPAVAALLEDEESPEEIPAEDEYELEPTGTPIGVYIVVGIIACILIALLGFALGRITAPPAAEGTPTDATTTVPTGTIVITDKTEFVEPNTMGSVPNVVGQDYDLLRGKYVENRAIKLAGFQYSDTAPAGTVLSQTPSSEEEADVTAAVYVMVSAGPEAIAVPDVAGWERDHAVAYMEALGFKVQVDEVLVTSVEFGKVESSSPAKNTVLARGNTVRLRVSVKETTAPTTTTTTAWTPTATTTTTTKPSSSATTTTTAKPSSSTGTTTTTVTPSSTATTATTTTAVTTTTTTTAATTTASATEAPTTTEATTEAPTTTAAPTEAPTTTVSE